jgi:hypothetical protein
MNPFSTVPRRTTPSRNVFRRPLALALLSCRIAFEAPVSTQQFVSTPAGRSQSDLSSVLVAPGPHHSLGDQARLFDRFVGTWDCGCAHFAPDGSILERYSGEVTFAWIIDGRAMQDVWIGYPRQGATEERSIGTSLRFFDQKSRVWRVVWVAPDTGAVTTVEGGAVGNRIVLNGENADGSLRRWSFNDIQTNSFVWRGESSVDGGKTWRITAEYRMTRRVKGHRPTKPEKFEGRWP